MKLLQTRYTSYIILFVLLCAAACTSKIYNSTGANAVKITATPAVNPILKRMEANPYLRIQVNVPSNNKALTINSINGFIDTKSLHNIAKIALYSGSEKPQPSGQELLGSTVPVNKKFSISFKAELRPGIHTFWLSVTLKDDAAINHKLSIKTQSLTDASGTIYKIPQSGSTAHYTGIALRKPNDEQVNTYRIPGMVTTDKGTVIAVYDIRYDNDRDLPANIDIGMSRSTDKGETWDAMKNIIDMGGPKDNSGSGDPSVLFDPVTKTIWVSALWSKGNRSIAGSDPGLSPDETGQFIVTSSTDDGITWSKPYSITTQVKNPAWRLFFPGPGNGIAMADGKIVFPAQYWDENKIPHSTLVYSEDHGKTWKSGTGAKSNTTESQLVETIPGTIMLNMRDNRGKFRSVSTTTSMGQSWLTHATSYNTLTDPVCMASFIKAKVKVKGVLKDVLFFSNQNNAKSRKDLTIKASLDLGETWLPANQLLLDERSSYGYSALTRVDENTIGILYEGIRDLQFVKIPVSDIIK